MTPESTKERPYVGQVRFGIRDSWVDVSDGPTFGQAAAGAAAAYGETRDACGRSPWPSASSESTRAGNRRSNLPRLGALPQVIVGASERLLAALPHQLGGTDNADLGRSYATGVVEVTSGQRSGCPTVTGDVHRHPASSLRVVHLHVVVVGDAAIPCPRWPSVARNA